MNSAPPRPTRKRRKKACSHSIGKIPAKPGAAQRPAVHPRRGPDLSGSIDLAPELCQMSPDYAPYFHLLGHYEWRSGHHGKAATAFGRASSHFEKWMKENKATVADCPEWVKAECYRIVSLVSKGDFDTAYAASRQVAATPDPEKPRRLARRPPPAVGGEDPPRPHPPPPRTCPEMPRKPSPPCPSPPKCGNSRKNPSPTGGSTASASPSKPSALIDEKNFSDRPRRHRRAQPARRRLSKTQATANAIGERSPVEPRVPRPGSPRQRHPRPSGPCRPQGQGRHRLQLVRLRRRPPAPGDDDVSAHDPHPDGHPSWRILPRRQVSRPKPSRPINARSLAFPTT